MKLVHSHPELIRDTAWKTPEIFDMATPEGRKDVHLAIETGLVREVVDPIFLIAQNLHQYERPQEDDEEARRSYIDDILMQGDEFGKWVLFPWSGQLAHFPDKEDHQKLRTARNRDLITPQEQRVLLGKTVAVFGLSVGSNVVDAMLRTGIGGKYIVGDLDALEPPNLNRINATAVQTGQAKVGIVARRISEVDPYIEQVHFKEGFQTSLQHQLCAEKPDIIIEEVDSMAVMAALRVFARDNGLPLITGTDIDLRSIIDVERYDQPGTKLFGGRISDKDIKKLLHSADILGISERDEVVQNDASSKNDPVDNTTLMLKHLGLSNISLRMMESSIGRDDLGDSFPQLGTTAGVTGSLVAVAAREILLGRSVKSGRYVENVRRSLRLPHEHSVSQATAVIASLVKYLRD